MAHRRHWGQQPPQPLVQERAQVLELVQVQVLEQQQALEWA
jgi:hypothetical protein